MASWPLLLIKSGMPADIGMQSCLASTERQFRHLPASFFFATEAVNLTA